MSLGNSIRIFSFLAMSAAATAADYYVDNKIGRDDRDGLSAKVEGDTGPFASVAKAVALLKPGDTVHFADTGKPYRQSVVVNDLQGEADNPITFDGHGAWLVGADHVVPEQWNKADVGPEGTLVLQGVKLDQPFWNTLCIDGKMLWGDADPDALQPGEFHWMPPNTLYHNPAPDFKDAAIVASLPDGTSVELPPATWGHTNFKTPGLKRNRNLKQAPASIKVNGNDVPLSKQPALDRLKPGHFYNDSKTFYYLPPEGKTVQDVKIMAVLRASGVALNGKNRHLVFKNFNTIYLGNDGYNIHGDSKDIMFLNCNAFFTGDEGFSSHDHCETVLDGGVFLQCSSGIHNVGNAVTLIRNVIVDHSGLRNDRQDKGFPLNEISNTILIDCGIGTTQTRIDNVLTVNGGISPGKDVTIKNASIVGAPLLMRVDAGVSVALESCLFFSEKGVIHARMDDPAAAFTFRNTWYAPGTVMEWGAKYPWTRKPLTEWLDEHPDNAQNNKTTEVDLAAALQAGQIPDTVDAGMGCSRELLQRYLEFKPKQQALIQQALDMAWQE